MREGGDASQGKGQVLSNIGACQAIVDILATTLGPRGMDKLIVDGNGKTTISNDGATIIRLLEVIHPAARTLVDIARAQDAEVGDGTTSVVLLAGELLRQARQFVEECVPVQVIIRGFRRAAEIAVERVKEIAVTHQSLSNENGMLSPRDVLERCASTSMNSKLIRAQKSFFSQMVVDAVLLISDPKIRTIYSSNACDDSKILSVSTISNVYEDDNSQRMIGIKKVTGGAMQDSVLVDGVAFEKTFSYAGFEQQPKHFENPKILLLNIELELKAERDNAEIRVEKVEDYQRIVDAEWSILFERLEKIAVTGANIVLSRLPIGDVATQFFAERSIFAAGRVPDDDLARVASAVGAPLAPQTSVEGLIPAVALGTCDRFEEKQVGDKRYNFFTGCPKARTCTILLRGGSEQFIAEVERSLHDAIMVVRRATRMQAVVAGGGAIEMDLARHLRDVALTIPGKSQLIILAFAQAFEVIPRCLCENAGFDATDILTQLRKRHASGERWTGVDIAGECVSDNMASFVWEPASMKVNLISAAAEAACTILSVDLTIKPAPKQNEDLRSALPGHNH